MGKKKENQTGELKKEKKGYRLQTRSAFLTYPQCHIKKERALLKLKRFREPSFICVSQETHEDGNPHLHALIQWKDKFETKNATFFDLVDSEDENKKYHGNYQSAKNNEDVLKYIKKDENYLEDGVFQSNKQSEVQRRALENKKILTTPLNQLVDSGEISIHSYVGLRMAKTLYTLDSLEVPEYMPKTCLWIWGGTGIGKSRYVRTNYSGFFNKAQNKWWDGYNGENTVLIDDFDHSGNGLGHLLKIWGDCYSFTAEIKGGTIKPVINTFIITSQYEPKDIWCKGDDQNKWDDELRKAIERRFKMKTIDSDGITLIDL